MKRLAIALLASFPLIASAGNLQVKCGRFDIKIYPDAIFLNGNKVDNAHRKTESDVMSYVFQEYAEMAKLCARLKQKNVALSILLKGKRQMLNLCLKNSAQVSFKHL